MASAGMRIGIDAPGSSSLVIGTPPPRAVVHFHIARALDPLVDHDHLRLAEAFICGEIDVDGDLREVMAVTEEISLDASWWDRFLLAARLAMRNQSRYDRESISLHYDRPAEFFLPWLGRWRCYSHGIYRSERDPLDEAIERKMQCAIEALGLEPGMRVFDMGGGWGCFAEYAGQRGIRVHAVTISQVQYEFVSRLIREQGLPCTVELVNFRNYRPSERFDAAVFMGTLEHNPDYDTVARWLARWLTPTGRLWADFCAQRTDFQFGRFMKKYIWPGPTSYVNPAGLCRALLASGMNIHSLSDDTRSYACTTRDWADGFEAAMKMLGEQFGERAVRTFRLYLRASQFFFEHNRTQAYHLVAGRVAGELRNTATWYL
jgi:cyclopropane-fatty-acyl-phospholipid synthase